MIGLVIVVGALIALVLVVAMIGALVPRTHVARRSARYQQRPEALWQTIGDFEHAASWRSEVQRVVRLPDRDGHPVWEEFWRGRPHGVPLEVVESAPPRRLVMRIADSSLPFGGTWTYELAPEGEGCRLAITEEGEIRNPFFRFLSRFVFGYTGTLDQYLRALGRKFGESVTPGRT